MTLVSIFWQNYQGGMIGSVYDKISNIIEIKNNLRKNYGKKDPITTSVISKNSNFISENT